MQPNRGFNHMILAVRAQGTRYLFATIMVLALLLSRVSFAVSGPIAEPGRETQKDGTGSSFLLAPPKTEGPVVVWVGFTLQDINEIHNGSEAFEFSGKLTIKWNDPRQAFDPSTEGVKEKIYQGNYQFKELSTGWFPQMVLVNESGMYQKNGVILRIQPDGTSTLIETINATAESEMNMRQFPFDEHRLQAVFEVLGFDKDEVLLQKNPDTAGPFANGVRLSQWALKGVRASVQDRAAFYTVRQGVSSTFVLNVDVKREPFYIIRLVVFPLVVIVLLSFSVFWMNRELLGDRLNVSFIGILTAVAYLIVMSDELPHISYYTLIHGFLNLSLLTMCATILVNIIVGEVDKQDKFDLGDRIDFRCRWGFPLVYLGLLLVMYVVAILFF